MKIDKIDKGNIRSFGIGKFQILKIEGCEVLVRYFEHFSPLNEDPLYIIEVGPTHKKLNFLNEEISFENIVDLDDIEQLML